MKKKIISVPSPRTRLPGAKDRQPEDVLDRKSTRLNSSHRCISYAVFCLKKKKKTQTACRHNLRQKRKLHPTNEPDDTDIAATQYKHGETKRKTENANAHTRHTNTELRIR